MTTKTNNKQNIKIAQLEILVKETRNDVRDIKDNHLKNIYKKLDAQQKWLISILTAIIIGFIVNYFK